MGWELRLQFNSYSGEIGTSKYRSWDRALRRQREREKLPQPSISISSNGAHADTEIAILAKDRDRAQYALKLILLGTLLVSRDLADVDDYFVVPPDVTEARPEDQFLRRPYHRLSTNGLIEASYVAARLSQRRQWQVAAWKLFYACRYVPLTWRDLHPRYSEYRPIPDRPDQMVAYADCILLAYGVIEDLGLEIRANEKKPSRISGKKNPIVFDELAERLRAAHVDPEFTVPWTVRARRSLLKSAREIEGPKSSWSWGPIRDRDVSVVDAIAAASYLRSKVSAHGSHRLTASLSIYDVANAQQIAWMLLVMTIGV